MRTGIRPIINALKKSYPDAECELRYRGAFQLLIATILSAQCTDKLVNLATPALFARYPTPKKLAAAMLPEVEALIRTLGLFRNKARSIVTCAQMLCADFDGAVPDTIEQLVRLPGVGRKTANCVLVNAFQQPGIMADTHCLRLSARLGLIPEDEARDPVKVELGLKAQIPAKEQAAFSHALILHGRRVCHARNPACPECCLRKHCPYAARNL